MPEAPKRSSYNSQVLVSLPTGISHVAFTADESHLVLGSSAGGLAVYSVHDLASGGHDPKAVLELATDGELREVKPNPMAPELVAIATVGGEVRMVNLKTRGWESDSNGDVVLKPGYRQCHGVDEESRLYVAWETELGGK